MDTTRECGGWEWPFPASDARLASMRTAAGRLPASSLHPAPWLAGRARQRTRSSIIAVLFLVLALPGGCAAPGSGSGAIQRAGEVGEASYYARAFHGRPTASYVYVVAGFRQPMTSSAK